MAGRKTTKANPISGPVISNQSEGLFVISNSSMDSISGLSLKVIG